MQIRWKIHCQVVVCTDRSCTYVPILCIPIAGEVEEKEDFKINSNFLVKL